MNAPQKPAAIRVAVTEAACQFEARWTLRALRRVDAELHGKLTIQRDLWNEAYVTGSEREAERHGEAMVRGWNAAIRAMEAAAEPADAYFEGFDGGSGTRVLIGPQRASLTVLEPGTIFITPDEVAALLAKPERELVGDILRQFPGGEVVDVRSPPTPSPTAFAAGRL